MEGKTEAETKVIWDDWRKKRLKKRIADAYTKIVLRVKDLPALSVKYTSLAHDIIDDKTLNLSVQWFFARLY